MAEENILLRIPRTATEEVHVQINEYKGKKYLDLRVFYTKDGGATWNPTQKGVTIYPDRLAELKDAIEEAQSQLEGLE